MSKNKLLKSGMQGKNQRNQLDGAADKLFEKAALKKKLRKKKRFKKQLIDQFLREEAERANLNE